MNVNRAIGWRRVNSQNAFWSVHESLAFRLRIILGSLIRFSPNNERPPLTGKRHELFLSETEEPVEMCVAPGKIRTALGIDVAQGVSFVNAYGSKTFATQ